MAHLEQSTTQSDLKRILKTEDLYQHSILINKQNKTAIYTGLCNGSSKPGTKKKKKDKADISKRGIRVKTAEKQYAVFSTMKTT